MHEQNTVSMYIRATSYTCINNFHYGLSFFSPITCLFGAYNTLINQIRTTLNQGDNLFNTEPNV